MELIIRLFCLVYCLSVVSFSLYVHHRFTGKKRLLLQIGTVILGVVLLMLSWLN